MSLKKPLPNGGIEALAGAEPARNIVGREPTQGHRNNQLLAGIVGSTDAR